MPGTIKVKTIPKISRSLFFILAYLTKLIIPPTREAIANTNKIKIVIIGSIFLS
jgi:hypothetical protein